MPDYVDILISDNDLTLGIDGEPDLIYDRDCIIQDIKHLIRESGLMVAIVGQRRVANIQKILGHLTLLIEGDTRLIPGTVLIKQTLHDEFCINAKTYKYGAITLQVNS